MDEVIASRIIDRGYKKHLASVRASGLESYIVYQRTVTRESNAISISLDDISLSLNLCITLS